MTKAGPPPCFARGLSPAGSDVRARRVHGGAVTIESDLPDDSREADEREEARRLRDFRGRVKLARAVVSNMPGLAETIQRDWRKAALFYARFGVSESVFRHGVPSLNMSDCPG